MNYTVSLYDKDMDYYLDIADTDNKNQAIAICRAAYKILTGAYVLNKEHSTGADVSGIAAFANEQFDWVQVSEGNACIYVNDKEYK